MFELLGKSKKNESDKKNTGLAKQAHAPKIAQDSVPYLEAYENGVFQVESGVFTKSFEFGDISFKTKSDEEQQRIYENYMKFLNSINPKEDMFISIINSKSNSMEKAAAIVSPIIGDELDVYREEMSKMILDKQSTTNNNIESRKVLTIRIEAPSVDEAMQKFEDISSVVSAEFKKFTGESLKEIDLSERLYLLQGILNSDEPNYYFEHEESGKVNVNFPEIARQGLTTKDIICPEFLKFNGNDFEIGERFGIAYYLKSLANWLNSNFFIDIASLPFESVVTLHISSIPQEKSIKMIKNQSVNINSQVQEKQKKLAQEGYNPDNIPIDLRNAQEQIEELQSDLLNRDQRLFYMSLNAIVFGQDKKEAKTNGDTLKNTASKYMCSMAPLIMQQERGFTSSLPVGIDSLYTKRIITTEALGVFIPFDEVNTFDKGGFYYGMNTVNKSIIVYNRLKGQNYNGLILGSSGSGKSFSAKREMVSVILNTDSDIYIIDPDGEYTKIADSFGGSVIKISPGNGVYINPLDLDTDTSQDSDYNPISMKSDFICGMLETMIGGNAKLNPIQRSLVERCIRQIYRPYIEHLQELPPDKNGVKKTIDREYCPTLQNLFDALLSQSNMEAQQLALVMESYVTGNSDSFAHRTNVNLNNRIIVYNIKDVGTNMMELALKVCLNDVWNKMMENRRKGKWTWMYVDEFHLLLANPSTSEFLKSFWKRCRKWQGVPTGITQNVEDLLASTEARAIINNSSFVYMMNQSAMDRNMLQELLNLTDTDVEFITNAEPGCGLIHTGRQSIPFTDHFPTNTKLYKIMSSKPDDD